MAGWLAECRANTNNNNNHNNSSSTNNKTNNNNDNNDNNDNNYNNNSNNNMLVRLIGGLRLLIYFSSARLSWAAQVMPAAASRSLRFSFGTQAHAVLNK